MNKRKVLSILLLALITVTLAVSCSGSIDTPKQEAEELAYVTFGNGHSRGLSTSYETKAYGTLYWFYTAQKTDSYGTTGQVGLNTDNLPTAAVSKGDNNAPAKGLSGQVGPFSQGAWKFKLYAYAEDTANGGPDMDNLIYSSEEVAVTLKGNEVKNVPVSVSTQGSNGYVKFKNAFFKWDGNSGDSTPTMEIKLTPATGSAITNTITLNNKGTDGKLTITDDTKVVSSTSVDTIPADFYTANVIVYLKDDDLGIDSKGTPVFSQTFGLRVYGNATTYISGDMVEGVTSEVTFDVAEKEMVVFSPTDGGAASFNVAVSPKGATTGSGTDTNTTKVEFPAGALAGAEHQLDVAVTPIASAEQNFQISGENNNETAVAGIDFRMVKVEEQSGSLKQTPVTSFGADDNGVARKVKITTFIATGLSNVQVKYLDPNNGPVDITEVIENTVTESTAPYYNPATGMLIFETSHFSQYVVVASVEAMNVSTGVPYTSLVDAIAAAGEGQIIQLKKIVEVSATIVVDKGIVLDLNGKTIKGNGTRALQFKSGNSIITGSGDVKAYINDAASSSVIRVGDNNATTDVSLTIDKEVTVHTETSYGISVFGSKYETLNVYGTVTSTASSNVDFDGCAVSTVGSDTTASTIIINEGASLSATNTNAIYMPSGNLIVNGGEITGLTGIYVKAGNTTILGGTVKGTGAQRDYEYYGNGGISTGDALVVDSCNYPNAVPVVSVEGGLFTSSNNKAVGSYTGNGVTEIVTGFIKGGTFSSDPKDYIAEGYIRCQDNGKYIVLATLPQVDGAYTISNADELIQFEKLVNIGKVSFSGKTVQLTGDVNLSGKTWTPVGQTGATQFQGTFDGQGHTISNLTVNNTDESEHCASGLFGWLNGATVKNLKIDGANVTGHHYVGVIAGYIETASSVIESCHVKNATVSCTSVNDDANGDKCGGIVGYAGNEGTSVINCTVSDSTISAGRDAGQVVGAAKTVNVSNCSASNVTVTANGTSTGANIRNEVIGRVL